MRSIGVFQFGSPLGALPPADYINQISIGAANTVVTQQVPANAAFVLIAASNQADTKVLFGGQPGGPIAANTGTNDFTAANVTTGTSGELNPLLRQLIGATSISVTANTACLVTLSYYN